MKQALDLISLALLSTLATVMLLSGCAAEKPTGQTPTDTKKSVGTTISVYSTAEQIQAMPRGKATVDHIETFSALLRTADGKQFGIGSERGEQEVWHFIGTALKVGQIYDFPSAFLGYQNRKFYPTAEAIKAMPPCTATLEQRGPCYSSFRTSDGKWFVIGDPGSKPEVWQFLRTLKDGQTYELPGAFLDYQNR